MLKQLKKVKLNKVGLVLLSSLIACSAFAKSELEKMPLSELHPTQMNVGLYQAEHKQLPELEGIVSECNIMKDYSGQDGYSTADCYQHELKDYLKESYIPLVKYGNTYYMDDHHHLAYALNLLFAKVGGSPEVYVKFDKENGDYPASESPTTVWNEMIARNQLWPYYYSKDKKEYVKIPDNADNGNPFKSLPQSVSDLGNDPYRSIFGLARSLDPIKFEKPSAEQTNFYQFKWAACLLSETDNQYKTDVQALSGKQMPQAIYGAKVILRDIANQANTHVGENIMQLCQAADPQEFNNIPTPQLKD